MDRYLTKEGLHLATRLLNFDPAGRPGANEALAMRYFTEEEPKPIMPDMYVFFPLPSLSLFPSNFGILRFWDKKLGLILFDQVIGS